MRTNDDRARVEIGADTNPRSAPTEREERPFRVLVLGDFSARTAARPPLEARIIERVDRDGMDAVIARIAPTLRLSIDPDGDAERIEFTELDDFHPDQLLSRVPTLARLRALRATVESEPVSSTGSRAGADAAHAVEGGSLLDRILEGEPPLASAGDAPLPSSRDDLSDFIRRAVRPHVSREVDPNQRALVEQVDAVLAATLRVLLHHPEFQALESLWRGVDFFMRRCVADDFSIGLLDIGRAELFDADSRHALNDRLMRSVDGEPWTLVIAAFSFGPGDVALLGSLAAMAGKTGVPWLAAAESTLGGAETFASNGDVDDWDTSPLPAWDALRREPGARYLGLALPRFLLRSPYGTDNPVDAITFEELESGAPAHESFLWGHPAFPCALVASTPVERGRPAPSEGTIDGFPVHIMRGNGGAEGLPCAEVLISQRAVMHLLARGLTPLVSLRDGDVVRVPRLQSIAEPSTALPIRGASGAR
jgi:type VI secretion system protein ImpC